PRQSAGTLLHREMVVHAERRRRCADEAAGRAGRQSGRRVVEHGAGGRPVRRRRPCHGACAQSARWPCHRSGADVRVQLSAADRFPQLHSCHRSFAVGFRRLGSARKPAEEARRDADRGAAGRHAVPCHRRRSAGVAGRRRGAGARDRPAPRRKSAAFASAPAGARAGSEGDRQAPVRHSSAAAD
ncbi:hypothetical protein OY671_010065, partial [Metschnikowia pulcherrima]